MNRFKCPACGRNQYTSKDEAEGCIYCVYKGQLELMDPADVEKTGEEVDEQLINLQIPLEHFTGDEWEIICPACRSYICYLEDVETINLEYRQFCGACGQKLNWESEVEQDEANNQV